jgi:hypothetical protein
MSRHQEHHEKLTNGVGKCSATMWSGGGGDAGFCDDPAYGHQRPLDQHEKEYAQATGIRRAFAMALACPRHGGPPKPIVCTRCNDTHKMTRGDREVSCTSCPRPCDKVTCRKSAVDAYCDTTPCPCDCHVEKLAAAPAVVPVVALLLPGMKSVDDHLTDVLEAAHEPVWNVNEKRRRLPEETTHGYIVARDELWRVDRADLMEHLAGARAALDKMKADQICTFCGGVTSNHHWLSCLKHPARLEVERLRTTARELIEFLEKMVVVDVTHITTSSREAIGEELLCGCVPPHQIRLGHNFAASTRCEVCHAACIHLPPRRR